MNRPTMLLCSALTALAAGALAIADVPEGTKLKDNFKDGVASPYWYVLERDPGLMKAEETGGKLTFELAPGSSSDRFAGYVSDGWAISLDSDAKMKLSFRFKSLPVGNANVGLMVAFSQNADIQSAELVDAIAYYAGRDANGVYAGYEEHADGIHVGSEFTNEPGVLPANGKATVYFWWHADQQVLRTSTEGYNDPDADVLSLIGVDISQPVSIVFGAYAEGSAPQLPSEAVFFNKLTIELAEFVSIDPPEGPDEDPPVPGIFDAEDTNQDGVVDARDLHDVILGLGGFCDGCPEDVNGDNALTTSDLLLVLESIGCAPADAPRLAKWKSKMNKAYKQSGLQSERSGAQKKQDKQLLFGLWPN